MNVDFKGYYRVHYNQNNWNGLAKQLKQNHSVFSPADRAQLIDDSFALSRAGLMGACTALDLAEYLDQEQDSVPWNAMIDSVGYINTLLEGLPAHKDLQVTSKTSVKYNQRKSIVSAE